MMLSVLKWIVISLFFLIVLCWFLLQNERVQNWAVQKTTTYLSQELNTTVKVDSVSIELFNKLVLEGVYVQDQFGDTLLYSQHLKSNLSANLLGIINGRLDVDEIYLQNAQINIHRDSSQRDNNLQFILDYLASRQSPKTKKKKKTSNPFLLNIDWVHLQNVHFRNIDVPKGEKLDVFIPEGNIGIDSLDFKKNRYIIGTLDLRQPTVTLDKLPQQLLPDLPKGQLVSLKEEQVASPDTSRLPLSLSVIRMALSDGEFSFHNYRKSPQRTKASNVLDFDHLNIKEISISTDSLRYDEESVKGRLRKMALKTNSGFILEELVADQIAVSGRRVELYGMNLQTPRSQIQDTLVLKYRSFDDFKNFEDKVLMDIRFKNSKVALKDIFAFAPALGNNAFFRQNEDEVVRLRGKISGRVNNLRGKNLLIQLAQGTLIKGNFSSRNLAVKSEEALNLKLDRLRTDMKTLRLLIPNFDPPPNFDKLGNIDFSGRFDGFFIDFVAFGELHTDLGTARVDMRMDLRNGRDRAKYSGQISLNDFDLKTWTGNPDFGNITFSSQVRDGLGLSRSTVNARLGAKIDRFTFKNYTYENLTMDGQINENFFDGKLNFKDDNIDFVFDGSIDYSDSIPEFNFKANVAHLDLHALNIIKQNYVFAGDLDLQLRDIDISRIEGAAVLHNFTALKDDSLRYVIDTLELSSVLLDHNDRLLKVHSEIFDASIKGQYDIQQLPEAILQFFENNYPEFADRLDLKSQQKVIQDNQFDYQLKLYDSKNFTSLFAPAIDTLKGINLKGSFDSGQEQGAIDLEVPLLKVGGLKFTDIGLIATANGSFSEIDLGVYHTIINNQQHIDPLSLMGKLKRDTFSFEISATNFTNVLDNLNLNGEFFMVDDFFQVSFLPSDLVILRENWDINENNYVRFGKGFIDTKNFVLRKDGKTIALKSISEKGLFVEVKGFDLSLIDELWNYDKMDFAGDFTITAEVQDVFKLEDVTTTIIADTFEVNGDDWGAFRMDADMRTLKSPIKGYASITKGIQQLIIEGYFIPPNAKGLSWMRNKYEINGNITNYPLHIAEYWIADGVTNTRGSFDGKVKIYGHGKPHINGEVQIKNLETTVDYLQTRYYAAEGTLKINDEYLFDASGNTIKDKYGNEAEVFGGITHTWLKKLRLNARVKSDLFLVLDTKKKDNDIYYGHCVGAGDIRFTGPMDKANISIEASTGKGSELFIQLSEGRDASEVSFIRFIDKNEIIKKDEDKKQIEIKGIEVDMNVSFNDEAEVYLIFDERAGDVIKGNGDGDLQLYFSRSGNFTMYGDYEIEQGEYLFTYYNIVNKPFQVQKGGTIRWAGDPYNAQINLMADYKGLNTSLYNFLLEYLNDDFLKSQARNSTNVDLSMNLTGQLIRPDIVFGISFPELAGELKSYADSKMRVIRGDQNELNRQVFGLLVIGGFLPSGPAGFAGVESQLPINTLSELVSNQLSIYLTELLSEVFTDVGFISGVDFDINYSRYQANELSTDGPSIRQGSELELDFKYDLFNDRLSLNLGGGVDWANTSTAEAGAFLAGEYVLEYSLSQDRKFKVRFYQKTDQSLLAGRNNKTGFGLSYRKEFDSFREFFGGMKRSAQRVYQGN